jgi:Kef-type K+ transport system membrane component KefB
MNKMLPIGAALASLGVPFLAAAQSGVNVNAIKTYSSSIIMLINTVLVPVLFAIAFLYFIYGVYKYFILGAANDKERENGRSFVLWSVIGFAVILSVWGLVAVVGNTFGFTPGGTAPGYPQL